MNVTCAKAVVYFNTAINGDRAVCSGLHSPLSRPCLRQEALRPSRGLALRGESQMPL